MSCTHERLRCTDNRFFCLICGQEVSGEVLTGKSSSEPEKPPEVAKKPRKRNAKKVVE